MSQNFSELLNKLFIGDTIVSLRQLLVNKQINITCLVYRLRRKYAMAAPFATHLPMMKLQEIIITFVGRKVLGIKMKAKKIIGIIFGVLMIISGIYCVCTPISTYFVLPWVLGFNMLFAAVGQITTWHERKDLGVASGYDLASSIISVLFAIVLLINNIAQFATGMFFLYLGAIWICVIGIIRIIHALHLKTIHKELDTVILGSRWGWMLAAGIILLIIGVLCFIHPSVLAVTTGVIIGVMIISTGINIISLASYI